MKKIVFLFPGQGSQYVGMGKDFYHSFKEAKDTFDEASEILNKPLTRLMFEGPDEELTYTENSQCAIFVLSMAILRCLPSVSPSICTGLSLGEYSALCASGKLSFKDTLKLVSLRASFMNDACKKNKGSMSAVLGMNRLEVDRIFSTLHGVNVANYNAPGQIVISGTQEGVSLASSLLKESGAKRIIPLQVSGAFHSPLMADAANLLKPHIEMASINSSPIDLVMNVTGTFVDNSEEIKKCLIEQVTGSVKWEQGIEIIDKSEPDLYLEIGSGKVLTGLNKKIGVSSETISVEKCVELDQLERFL